MSSPKINYQPGPLRLASKRPAITPIIIRWGVIGVISSLLAWAALGFQRMGNRQQEIAQGSGPDLTAESAVKHSPQIRIVSRGSSSLAATRKD